MNGFLAAYVPVGVPTFDLECAADQFEKSKKMLSGLSEDFVFPEEMLLSVEKLNAFLDGIDPDLIVLQNVTFANSAYAAEVVRRFDCPILLWTLREPVSENTGRLRLNSLTGAFSAANTIRCFRDEPFEYMLGSPEEDGIIRKARAVICAAKVKKALRSLKITAIGHTPQGFGFGRALDSEMAKRFGCTLLSIEARELIDEAGKCSDSDALACLETARESMNGLDCIPEKNRLDFARLFKAYRDYVVENGVGAVSSRCWPDFFTAFGTPVCAVLAMLNDLGIAASCEADTWGALSMKIGSMMTGAPVFFGDPVSLDEEENTITFWHCGTAACSLAREDTGACVGVHCNRRIGPTLEFGCRSAEKVTVFRIGREPSGDFRFFISSGSALDMPQRFYGTSVVVRTDSDARRIVTEGVLDGWEPHFAVVYGDVSDELEILGHMLNIRSVRY